MSRTLASHTPIPPPQSSLQSPTATTPKNVHKYSFTPIHRRHLLASLAISLTAPFLSTPNTEARGLFQMPPPRLSNRYFLVRAGESEFESMGIINTNPVAKTSMDNGLSEKGKKQTVKAALELKAMGACDQNCWIWPSITQRAYQAAEVIAAVNGVNRRYPFCILTQIY
ncbi:hypothetical protein RHMOL_Rhmol08G0236600 [Rhododendron molle]|uniref:Uncharacterized protein n=1 Tax=Rhododendron molle TaxID=49168 RepID=A0ACC0MRR2_RHOML|nr:hypothetical protein RHMOL_Rhmol08G0236600 [Rhododendron molle]